MSSILDPTSITLPPFTIPDCRSVMVSLAMPLIINFCADCGTPHIRSKCAFKSNTVASYANVMSCFALLKTTVNSICSGISQNSGSKSSVASDVHAAASLSAGAGTSMCALSTILLFSAVDFDVPLAIEFGSRFSVESPFSEARN